MTILLSKIVAGELYAHDSGETVMCSAPRRCTGSESGLMTMMVHVDGHCTAETRDGVLRPATMREQRDYYRSKCE